MFDLVKFTNPLSTVLVAAGLMALASGSLAQTSKSSGPAILVGSFIGATNFDSKIKGAVSCSTSVFGICESSAVAELENALMEQQSVQTAETSPAQSSDVFDLKISTSKRSANLKRSTDLPDLDFKFASSFAFLK